MKFFKIKNSIPKAGHYTPGVLANNGLLFISAQVPVDPQTGKIIKGDLETEFRQVLKNLKGVLEAAGAEIEDLVKVNIYVGDGNDWFTINNVYREFMGKHKPARTILPVLPMHNGYKVEVEAVAEIKDNK